MTRSENITVLRLHSGRLAVFTPGSGQTPNYLDDDVSLQAFIAEQRQSRRSLVFAAPGEDVRLQQLTISQEEKKHLAKSLPYMLEEELAGDVDQLHFASAPLTGLDYAVAVCDRDKMLGWQSLLAGIEGVDHWVNEVQLLPWREGEWCLLFEDDKVLLRTDVAAGASAECELLPVLLGAAVAEADAPQALVVYGQDQAAELALIPQELQSAVQWRHGNFCSALLLTQESQILPNLLQGDFAPRLPLQRWWHQWRLVAAALFVAFGLQLLSTALDYWQLKQENTQLRTAVEHSYRQAFPRGNAPEPVKQLRQQLASMQGSAQTSGFVSLMDKVGSVIAARQGTSIASINYSDRGGELRMNIVAADYTAVEQIREGINAAGLTATLESSSAQGEQVRARIRVGGQS